MRKTSGYGDNTRNARNQANTTFYVKMLTILAKRFGNKETAKTIYSYVIMGLTIFIVAGAGLIVWHLSKNPDQHIVAFVTAVGGLLSTLLGLPLIVVRSLFDKEEDAKMLDQVSSLMTKMIEMDEKDFIKRTMKENEIKQQAEASEDRLNEEVSL